MFCSCSCQFLSMPYCASNLVIDTCRLILCQLLAVAGAPYDTLEEVIGIRDSNCLGSLKDFGIEYQEVPVSYLTHILFFLANVLTFILPICYNFLNL